MDFRKGEKEILEDVEGSRNYEHVPFNEENLSGTDDLQPATFEEAITATGFGKYNLMLMVLIIFPSTAEVFELLDLSYVLPIAQCDLKLTLGDKGMLTAMTFAGMVTSSLFWGRLCDTVGRKPIIIYGYLISGGFAILTSLSTNVTMLSIAKFFAGFIINGPYSGSVSHLSEFHSSKYRARVQIVRGIILSSSNIILPLMAWVVLPRKLDFSPFGLVDYHSWNVFLFVCAIPAIISGITYFFLPESPKFLMTLGRNEEALAIFRKVYRINTGRPEHTYPISYLVKENYSFERDENKSTIVDVIKEGVHQMKPFLNQPHISRILLTCSNALFFTMSINLMKLWLPQIFQSTSDHQLNGSKNSSDVCAIFEELRITNVTDDDGCRVNLDNTSVYINSMIVGTIGVIAFCFAGTLVNLLGKKTLTIILSFAAGSFWCSIYFSPNSNVMLILYSLDLAMGSVSDNVLTTTTLELFPTTLRTSALCLHLMFGRIGTVVGNIVLPKLLAIGCAPPIFFLGSLVFYDPLMVLHYTVGVSYFGHSKLYKLFLCSMAIIMEMIVLSGLFHYFYYGQSTELWKFLPILMIMQEYPVLHLGQALLYDNYVDFPAFLHKSGLSLKSAGDKIFHKIKWESKGAVVVCLFSSFFIAICCSLHSPFMGDEAQWQYPVLFIQMFPFWLRLLCYIVYPIVSFILGMSVAPYPNFAVYTLTHMKFQFLLLNAFIVRLGCGKVYHINDVRYQERVARQLRRCVRMQNQLSKLVTRANKFSYSVIFIMCSYGFVIFVGSTFFIVTEISPMSNFRMYATLVAWFIILTMLCFDGQQLTE